jgi:hypothetical protein
MPTSVADGETVLTAGGLCYAAAEDESLAQTMPSSFFFTASVEAFQMIRRTDIVGILNGNPIRPSMLHVDISCRRGPRFS